MTWSIAIGLHIILAPLATIVARRLSLTDRKAFFTVGGLMHFAAAVAGLVYSLALSRSLPSLPSVDLWCLLAIEGIFLPAAWLLQYKIISQLGAANSVIITGINFVGAAIMGLLFLNESLSLAFVIGAILILSSIGVVFRVQPDTIHRSRASWLIKAWSVGLMMLLYAIGMFAEKQAIDMGGVWDYAVFGWGMQLVGAICLFALFGRKEFGKIRASTVKSGILLGFITSLAGLFIIYALSLGPLSHTVIAVAGKIAVTALLAAVLLKERNQLGLRLIALVLSAGGIVLILL